MVSGKIYVTSLFISFSCIEEKKIHTKVHQNVQSYFEIRASSKFIAQYAEILPILTRSI